METIYKEKKSSFFSKLINRIKDLVKHSALYNIFINPESGMVYSPEDTSSERKIESLAKSSGMSKEAVFNIEAAFNTAINRVGNLLESPKKHKDPKDPFKVSDAQLSKQKEVSTPTRTKHGVAINKDSERVD